ncbi:hypothetical protein R1flu_000776 [Riccia fluitans]|uniref:CP-type G domain-containing protein n=1 Tax=Riccia fluitans TaxID=41844 RepID=A0ABD1Y1E5_9MARC
MGWRKKTKPLSGPGLTLMNKRKADGDKMKSKGKGEKTVLESVMEVRDLDAVMEQAELAGRIFSANNPLPDLLISAEAEEASSSATPEGRRESRETEEAMYRANLTVPRRPEWNSGMTAEELDAIERKAFLTWRRGLASLEENDKLVLTPFEKNIDIWRQLWRVLERSDLVVVVVDSRNPLFYRCPDLEDYTREIDPNKKVMLLLNKADLLTTSTRQKWATYFKAQGIPYLFWSAKAASAELEGKGQPQPTDVNLFTQDEVVEENEDTHLFEREELLERLQKEAEAIVESRKGAARAALSQHLAGEGSLHNSEDSESVEGKNMAHGATKSGQSGGRVVVGFVGYPNVGKSSTINALVGEKKTGVTSTPGKTKHFQTLIINEKLMLCDCPGLVFPSFSTSKAEMVACGVLPIDKLTDHRGPVQVVANVVPRSVLQKIYGIKLPEPKLYEAQNRPPTAAELLFVYAVSRGYFANSGLPDETRAARLILKDFLGGKLPYCILPPGESGSSAGVMEETEGDVEESDGSSEGDYEEEGEDDEDEESVSEVAAASQSLIGLSVDEDDGVPQRRASSSEASSKAGDRDGKMLGVVDTSGANLDRVFDDLDSSLLSEIRQAGKDNKKVVKAPHKMHKKAARKKDRTWRAGSNQEKVAAPVVQGVKIPVSHGAADLYQVPVSSKK